MKLFANNSIGQTMVEIIIVVGIVIIILSVVVTSAVRSLQTTTFSTSKSQATAYAKEGIELARAQRDAGWYLFESKGVGGIDWCVDEQGVWTQGSVCATKIDGIFTRIVRLTLDATNPSQKQMNIQSTVTWQEGAETRRSEIITVLTQWR